MRPAEMIFGGPIGAYRVLPAGDQHCDVICRNGMTKLDSALTVEYDLGKKIEKWLSDGKPGMVQDVFPELTVDQREQMISGLTPKDWLGIFGEDDYA